MTLPLAGTGRRLMIAASRWTRRGAGLVRPAGRMAITFIGVPRVSTMSTPQGALLVSGVYAVGQHCLAKSFDFQGLIAAPRKIHISAGVCPGIRNDGVTGSNPVCGTSGSDRSYPNIREDPWLRIDAENPQLRTPAEFFRPSAALMRRS